MLLLLPLLSIGNPMLTKSLVPVSLPAPYNLKFNLETYESGEAKAAVGKVTVKGEEAHIFIGIRNAAGLPGRKADRYSKYVIVRKITEELGPKFYRSLDPQLQNAKDLEDYVTTETNPQGVKLTTINVSYEGGDPKGVQGYMIVHAKQPLLIIHCYELEADSIRF